MSNILQASANGQLQISVFTETVGQPVDNADVIILPHGSDSQIIERHVSDSSGLTPPVLLPAPPLEFSLSSSMPKPYREYDLVISADGFEPAKIEGVQILPNCIALQDVFLKPITVGDQETVINIDQNTLWGTFPPKIPEDETKPLPPEQGFVVLPDPVIPEYIIVHAGAPSAAAQNYWVPFKDYIKNVASCEIYSTWPTETIRANVLAIISFTLNRVYTEWYRGKGYIFTITNSTAFDHAFTFGRNIYENISRIVDEMFTTYITRPAIRQPLLTQYCDGKKVSCPNWMTQWGSKTLGDRGYTAIDILRNYYGNDIYLMQATKIAGVPSSFPGMNLQNGSTGNAVRTIQEQLNGISNNYPLIKKIRVDGIYGPQTLAAVETFQRVFKLPATGIVDFATWYAVSNIYVAVNRLAELR